jgi:hypothetical protein
MLFRAFLSYCRADDKLANRIHRRLDSYRTPKGLVGSLGEFGKVIERLHPIFRDRFDFSSGGELTSRITEALKNSESLVILCSTRSAGSAWVNSEVEIFLKHHSTQRIFPIISPDTRATADLENECFPLALRGKGILAADLRDLRNSNGQAIGDGFEGGVLKTIAGLLGVPLDQLIRREQARQRRRLAAISLASIVFSIVAVAAAGFGFRANQLAILEKEMRITAEAKSRKLTDAVMLFRELYDEQADPKSRIPFGRLKLVRTFTPTKCNNDGCRTLSEAEVDPKSRYYFSLLRKVFTDRKEDSSGSCFGACKAECDSVSSPYFTLTRTEAECAASKEAADNLHAMAVYSAQSAGRTIIAIQLQSAFWGRPMGTPALPMAFLARERASADFRLIGVLMYVSGRYETVEQEEEADENWDKPNVSIRWLRNKTLPDLLVGDEFGFAASEKNFRFSLYRYDPHFNRYTTICLARGEYDNTSSDTQSPELLAAAEMSMVDCSLEQELSEKQMDGVAAPTTEKR